MLDPASISWKPFYFSHLRVWIVCISCLSGNILSIWNFLPIIDIPISCFYSRRTLPCRIVSLTLHFNEMLWLLNNLMFVGVDLILLNWAHFLIVMNGLLRGCNWRAACLCTWYRLLILNVILHIIVKTIHLIHLVLSVVYAIAMVYHYIIYSLKAAILDRAILVFIDELYLLLVTSNLMHLTHILNYLLFWSFLARLLLLYLCWHLNATN